MAGFLPDEGETLIANQVFKTPTLTEARVLNCYCSQCSPGETITAATLTEPTGTGYARIQLTDGSWSVTAGVASYALQTFTAGSGGWTGSVQGYAVVTKGTTPRIVAIEVDAIGPYTFAANDTYDVTPQVTVA